MGAPTSKSGSSRISRSSEDETLSPSVESRIFACLTGVTNLARSNHDPGHSSLLKQSVEKIREACENPESVKVAIHFRGEEHGDVLAGENAYRAKISLRGVVEGEVLLQRNGGNPSRMDCALIDSISTHISLILERSLAIGELENMRIQLRHADRLATIGQLAAGVAHQLNEPLGSILGFAELARKAPMLPEQAGADIDRIITSSLNAREVIRKLMLFARQMPPEKVRFTLDKIVNDSLQFFDSLCARQGIELVRELGNADRTILADETQLRQVLINLVVNAIQAMPNGGRLVVRTLEESHSVTLEVEDTGMGIARELHEQIFVPFFTTKDVDEGTGLGLAIVHGIVRAHSGEIIVRSEPGQGASFLVRLPMEPSPAQEEQHER